MWHDIRTKFHEDWCRHSKVNKGIYRHTDTLTYRKAISHAYFHIFQIRNISYKAGLRDHVLVCVYPPYQLLNA
jgi:hypothetical protein